MKPKAKKYQVGDPIRLVGTPYVGVLMPSKPPRPEDIVVVKLTPPTFWRDSLAKVDCRIPGCTCAGAPMAPQRPRPHVIGPVEKPWRPGERPAGAPEPTR